MRGYPITLNLEGRTVLVVGLGRVGKRKVQALREAGARVVGVDPVAESLDLEGLYGIDILSESYRAQQLHGVSLVIAAAPADVNRQVVADARERGLWVCSASDPDAGDFTVPAVWRSGPLVLSVSTSGASPALARLLRDQAAAALGPAAVGLAEVLAELRPLVLARLADPLARRRVFEHWADPRWRALWTQQGPEAVRRALVELIEQEQF